MMKRVLIGFLIDGKAGGIDKYIMNILPYLSKNYKVTVLTNQKNEELRNLLHEYGIQLQVVARLSNPVKQYHMIKKIVNEEKFEIAYLNTSTSLNLPFLMACKNKIPLRIIHSHSSGIDCRQHLKRKAMNVLQVLFKYITVSMANRYFACSKEAGYWMFPKKIVTNSNYYKFVPNMVDFTKFIFSYEKSAEMRKKLGLEGKKVVGHVSNFQPVKNVSFIIDIIKELCEISDEYRLLLIGEGPEKERILEKIKRENLGDKILVFPYQSNVQEYYQVMDYFVLPSFFEGLALVGIEAQVSKIYCIFSDAVTREIQVSNGCCFLPVSKGASIWAKQIEMVNWDRKNWRANQELTKFDLNNQDKMMKEIFQ